MANNLNMLDAIIAAKLGKGTGGGSGSVTKEYVDTQVGAVSERVDDVESVIPSAATPQNPLATTADVTIPSTSTVSPLTDSADGMVQELTIYGRSEVVDGEIKSVGDDGLTVTTANSDNTVTTSAEFTTALPLRGASDTVRDKLICTVESKQVETVCDRVRLADLTWNKQGEYAEYRASLVINMKGYADNIIANALCAHYDIVTAEQAYHARVKGLAISNSYISISDTNYTTVSEFVASLGDAELVYELAEPVTIPLTDTEISAFRGLKTYDGTTNITISDEPDFELDYLKNTDNGQAVADIQKDLQGQIDDKITVSPLLTLAANAWSNNTQTVTFPHDTSRRNVIDITIGENAAWDAAGVYAVSETAAGITFECSEIPDTALTFRVTSMEVS